MRKCFLAGLFLCLVLPVMPAGAQMDQFINYQGRLVDDTNLVNAVISLVLRVYDNAAGGALLCEDSNDVAVVDGLYSTFIGDGITAGSLAAIAASPEAFIEVTVNGTTLTPRERVGWVVYALNADTVGGMEAGEFVKKSGDTMTGVLGMDVGASGDLIITNRGDTILIGRGTQSLGKSVAIGQDAAAETNAASLGVMAVASAQSVAIGHQASAGSYAVAAGRAAGSESYGVAVGYNAEATDRGTALGYNTKADGRSVAIGSLACGITTNYSVGIAGFAKNQSVAVGAFAYSEESSIAIGASAVASNGFRRIAIGHDLKNLVNNSAAIRGTLYLDGGTAVYYRTTFGSGAWVDLLAGLATGTPLYVFAEADPVWAAEKAGYATGTPLYVETDPNAVLADGSRAMSGDLDMGGNDVTNVGSMTLGGESRSSWPVPNSLPFSAMVLSETALNTNLTTAGFAAVLGEPGIEWIQMPGGAAWPRRAYHAAVVHGGKMWILGGIGPGVSGNDVWYSTDGAAWTLATANAAWTSRYDHAAIAYDGKMWVLGGLAMGAYTNDVWYSTDGVAWSLATNRAAWSPRSSHDAVVYDGKMWVIGGDPSGSGTNDVWYSTDGANWTLATNRAPWSARRSHTAVAYDGKMWVVAGVAGAGTVGTNDVWYSTNGASWTLATGQAAWTARWEHAAAVYDGKMWILGGMLTPGTEYLHDVWYSTNGASWTLATNAAGWSVRHGHAAVVHGERLWVFGGYAGSPTPSYSNDVWHTPGGKKLGDYFLFSKN